MSTVLEPPPVDLTPATPKTRPVLEPAEDNPYERLRIYREEDERPYRVLRIAKKSVLDTHTIIQTETVQHDAQPREPLVITHAQYVYPDGSAAEKKPLMKPLVVEPWDNYYVIYKVVHDDVGE